MPTNMGVESSGKDTLSLTLTDLPDSLLLEVFSFLPAESLGQLARTCCRFNAIVWDELLWKGLFHRKFKVPHSVPMHPRAWSWRAEYKRLWDESPAVLCEELTKHKDQVLHVSFSHNGTMFATSSKDGKIMVWNASSPCTLKFCANMTKEFSWRYTQFSQFNKSDTLLLVSGVHYGHMTTSGEIAIFELQGFEPQCRVVNKPYDVFGTWYDDHHLLSGTLYWTGHLQSISAIWLNTASQETQSERESVLMNLYRFSNVSASSIRTIMVADVPVVDKETHTSQHATGGRLAVCDNCGLYRQVGGDNSVRHCDESRQRKETGWETGKVFGEWEEELHEEVLATGEDGFTMDWVEVASGDGTAVGNHDRPQREEQKVTREEGAAVQNTTLAVDTACWSQDVFHTSNHSAAKSACYGNSGKQTRTETGQLEMRQTETGQLEKGQGELEQRDYARGSAASSAPSLWCCCQGNKAAASSGSSSSSSASRCWSSHHQSEKEGNDQVALQSNIPQSGSQGSRSNQPNAQDIGCASEDSSAGGDCSGLKHASDIPRTNSTSTSRLRGRSLQTEKLLIFTLGEETYTPHLIGIKRIKREDIRGKEEEEGSMETENRLLPNVDHNLHGVDRLPTTVDHTINMHGHIVGMALSPDHRYLYVNSRQWPTNYHIEKVLEPPPIAQEIDIHVIDLVTFQKVGTVMTSHKAFTPNDECFFLFLDVGQLYVASGAEDKRGYLWDRHYGVHLRCFPHTDVVNSVAFNPRDPEELVTASDDHKIKVWRSRRRLREASRNQQTEGAPGVGDGLVL